MREKLSQTSQTSQNIAKKRKNYPKFRVVPEWLEFMGNMNKEDRGKMFDAIMIYGCFELEPTNLDGDLLEYFNKEIRPELDRQHKRLREGKEI